MMGYLVVILVFVYFFGCALSFIFWLMAVQWQTDDPWVIVNIKVVVKIVLVAIISALWPLLVVAKAWGLAKAKLLAAD